MRLLVALVDYSDDQQLDVTYATTAAPPKLDLSVKNIPSGTLTGSLTGAFNMKGRLEGDVTLNLTMAGQLEPVPSDPTKVQRKPGTTRVTGTASSPYGTFAVDVTR